MTTVTSLQGKRAAASAAGGGGVQRGNIQFCGGDRQAPAQLQRQVSTTDSSWSGQAVPPCSSAGIVVHQSLHQSLQRIRSLPLLSDSDSAVAPNCASSLPAAATWRPVYLLRALIHSLAACITHPSGLSRHLATPARLAATLASRLMAPGSTAGPTASFSMYMQGPGSNRAPRSATAMTCRAEAAAGVRQHAGVQELRTHARMPVSSACFPPCVPCTHWALLGRAHVPIWLHPGPAPSAWCRPAGPPQCRCAGRARCPAARRSTAWEPRPSRPRQ